MRAAVVSNDTAATPVSVTDVPTPEPRPGWVRVRLHQAALNRLDAMMIATRVELDRPAIFGSDGAGIVDAVGGGVFGVDVGSEVVLSPSLWWGPDPQAPGSQYEILGSPTDGTHAEYVVVPAENVHPKPTRLSMAEAAALPMAGVTAWRALVTRGRLTGGEKVVVGAASSGVGTMAIQIAKGIGAHVVAITSAAENADRVRRLGADQVVLRTEPDFADRLSSATGGKADLALDPTGALWQLLLQALRPGGRLVAVGKMAAEIAQPRVQTGRSTSSAPRWVRLLTSTTSWLTSRRRTGLQSSTRRTHSTRSRTPTPASTTPTGPERSRSTSPPPRADEAQRS